ncbi:hypothetical protein [Chryseobacterium sp. SL1]|uniref:hypothetical protein n=1 Tax=Chryseobacterium sp. SL1 TaxID=2995159 RepID=UPI0022761D81|nr:hypothetical protein [Chryseobacterium sp. SL1]MCY1660140.1 hypothetical protein [Chryseobacterium sp. SL1]
MRTNPSTGSGQETRKVKQTRERKAQAIFIIGGAGEEKTRPMLKIVNNEIKKENQERD